MNRPQLNDIETSSSSKPSTAIVKEHNRLTTIKLKKDESSKDNVSVSKTHSMNSSCQKTKIKELSLLFMLIPLRGIPKEPQKKVSVVDVKETKDDEDIEIINKLSNSLFRIRRK